MRFVAVVSLLIALSACATGPAATPSSCTPSAAASGDPNAGWKPIGLAAAAVPGIEAQMVAVLVAGGAKADGAKDIADGYIESGSTPPVDVPWSPDRPLQKIVPSGGQPPSAYTGYWTTPDVVAIEAAHPARMADDFALPPVQAAAAQFDVYEIRAKAEADVFVSVIARTFDANSCKAQTGGELQILVLNRKLFTDPVKIMTISVPAGPR